MWYTVFSYKKGVNKIKIITTSPATNRFYYELVIQMNNLRNLGFDTHNCVVLLLQSEEGDRNTFGYLTQEYGAEVWCYPDNRDYKDYIPNLTAYLWEQYLKQDPTRQLETYFYLDSDVIFRELPNFKSMEVSPKQWYCSDTLGYTNYTYIKTRPYGEEILAHMSKLAGVALSDIKEEDDNEGGAQWYLSCPTAKYWHDVYDLTNKFWQYFKANPAKNDLSQLPDGLQTWTASMWGQLWALPKSGIIPKVSKELDFCWSPDPIEHYHETKILHNSGVTKDMSSKLFFKADYSLQGNPLEEDLSYVDKSLAGYYYAQAIKATSAKN